MKKYFCMPLIGIMLAASISASPAIFIAGDSTAASYSAKRAPLAGWGQMLNEFTKPENDIKNLAVGGQSTLSFRNNGYWNKLLTQIKKGDYVILQFGHNDQRIQSHLHADAATAYQENLQKFADEVIARGAKPIIVSSISRRKFNLDGSVKDTLEGYPKAAKSIAEKIGVPFVDMTSLTRALVRQLGPEESKKLYNYVPVGHVNYPKGNSDDIHLNLYGAKIYAKIFVDAAKEQNLEIARCFK